MNPSLRRGFWISGAKGKAVTEWTIDKSDPARTEIVTRAKGLGIKGDPDRAAHPLGMMVLADGREVCAHVVHAIDPVITDGVNVVMIDRMNDPGRGKPALPGGFIDPAGSGVESGVQAAMREANEEAGVDLKSFSASAALVGDRNMDRPHDVRVARGHGLEKKYGIREGDIFMVSTQAVLFRVPDLNAISLVAGDDAVPGSARCVRIGGLTPENIASPDHLDMIKDALLLCLVPEKPLRADRPMRYE